ncbi:MAG: arylesterase [Actinomycetota bacterium]
MLRRTFLMAAAGGALLAACGRSAKLTPVPAGSVVLAFGDSVTYGTGASPGEDWPTLLGSLTGWRMVNGGVPGDTAEAGKGRIDSLLEEHRPALVIVEIGGNDFLRRRSQKAVKDDIRQILSAVRASGAAVVLVAVPELSIMGAVTGRPSDAALYAELGREEKVPVIPDVFSGILGQPELCSDQIHPNARGYRRMADGIDAALKKIGLHSGR